MSGADEIIMNENKQHNAAEDAEDIEAQTIAYYLSMPPEEQEEERRWARASSLAAFRAWRKEEDEELKDQSTDSTLVGFSPLAWI